MTPPRTTHPLNAEKMAQYERDGFVIVPGFFDLNEIAPIRKACEEEMGLRDVQTVVDDGAGRNYRTAIWTELDDSLFGCIPRMARLVDAAETLLGTECYHWHSKLLRKEPGDGRVGIHQDFGTWYEDGCLFPHLLTCTIAIDRSDRTNGCLQLVPRSHRMARIHRVKLGETTDTGSGPDPNRVQKAIEKLGATHCELDPGDALLFHCNTLHWSDANTAQRPRTFLHCSYNAVSNEPISLEGQEHHRYRRLQKLPDDTITEERYRSIFTKRTFHPRETADNPETGIFYRKIEPSPSLPKALSS